VRREGEVTEVKGYKEYRSRSLQKKWYYQRCGKREVAYKEGLEKMLQLIEEEA
jgi:hypothetical protein